MNLNILNYLSNMNLTDTLSSSADNSGDIFFIHKMGSQKLEIRQAFNWLLYVSYSCFLVSPHLNYKFHFYFLLLAKLHYFNRFP